VKQPNRINLGTLRHLTQLTAIERRGKEWFNEGGWGVAEFPRVEPKDGDAP